MLNFAILSAGNIAGRMARTLDSLRDEVQPYAIAARDSARAQALAGRYGFAKSFAGYEALLADPAVDVVYIGSIHPLHAQHIRAALLAGKHVLCEKPLTLNAAQAQSLFALARERGLLLAEAMWTRTLPFAQALRKTLADGRLGAPRLVTAVLGEAMARRVVRSSQRASIMGRFGRLVVAEAPVMHSSLAGKTLLDCSLRERTGINVVGVWDRGAFQLPGPHTMFTESSVLVVAGTEKQVRTFDRLISEPEKAEMENVPVVILGGGRVGLAVARNLARRKIPAVIVDRQPHINSGAIPHVHGDAADLAVLEKAGIRKTRTIIITTHDDDANLYLTIYSRRLRPDAQILCRASLDRNVNGLHSAGADQVLSLASLVSNSIINLLAPDKMMMLNERLLVFRYTIRGQLQGKSLMECGIRNKTKCSVLAVRDNTGTMHVNPDPGYIFALGDALYLIGDSEAEERFRERYGIDSNLACADADLS